MDEDLNPFPLILANPNANSFLLSVSFSLHKPYSQIDGSTKREEVCFSFTEERRGSTFANNPL